MSITPETLRALADSMGSRHPDEAATACRQAADTLELVQGNLDELGCAIADAGYTWTPEMRAAYERGTLRDGVHVDAARYRFLSECDNGDLFMECTNKRELDRAIDARMMRGIAV